MKPENSLSLFPSLSGHIKTIQKLGGKPYKVFFLLDYFIMRYALILEAYPNYLIVFFFYYFSHKYSVSRVVI